MPFSPAAPPAAALRQGNSPLSAPAPLPTIDSYPFSFSATGAEYFRIWIVNMLLIVVTLGIYMPWAKVRKLKYFYSNTRINEHALDFHGEPKKMLRGTAIVGVFFMVYSQAASIAPVAGAVALVALLALWPLLFRASMRFRLANTSWRGMRFRFADAPLWEPYLCLVLPLALLLAPSVVMGFGAQGVVAKGAMASGMAWTLGLIFVAFACSLPYFYWRTKRYQHNHYAWGPLVSEYRSGVGDTYKVFGLTALVVLLLTGLFGVALAVLLPTLLTSGVKGRGVGAIFWALVSLIPLLVVFIISLNIAPKAFFMARMQNLLWSRTGNRYFRFKSDLRARKFVALQFKNYFLILITLGLYWPFAVVVTKRMQIEAMALKARVDLNTLSDAARQRENDATGDMAADLFGLDMGM